LANVCIRDSALIRDRGWAQAPLHETTDQSIPEPGALALLGLGLIAVALFRRFKRS
jgi:hypothetical protein